MCWWLYYSFLISVMLQHEIYLSENANSILLCREIRSSESAKYRNFSALQRVSIILLSSFAIFLMCLLHCYAFMTNKDMKLKFVCRFKANKLCTK